jgi:hypothetical protein
MPIVLYGCETWSLTLREEHGLRMIGGMVLTRIFGPKMDEIIGGWKIHNREINNSYSSPSTYNYNYQVKEDEMGRECSTHGREEEYI